MSEQQSSYRQIMKATSIFGGVQIVSIIITIIRSKFIAVLLGPVGIGISGLLTSTTGLIAALTSFGLRTSAVNNIAKANGSGNKTRISIVIIVLRRLIWITGILGLFMTLILSPWLSEITFGNRKYTFAFIWISITLLFNQLSIGQMTVLQGMRKLQYLARASLIGSILGCIITIPLYYKFGIDGIIPAIIIASAISLFFSWYFARKIKIDSVKVSKLRTIAEAKDMLIMGFMISLTGWINIGTSYILRIYISNIGGIEQVGLFSAGFAIINTYVGLVLTSMASDYYPRLSSVAHDKDKYIKTINHQAEMVILILAPIIIIFLVFIKWGIILLYSTKFLTIDIMIQWAALGMLFKAASWSISGIFIAKSDSKLFFWNEFIANIYVLVFNLLGYFLFGLAGLGISFLISYIIYSIQVLIIANKKYTLNFTSIFYKIFLIQLSLSIISFFIMNFIISPYSFFLGGIIIIISITYSYIKLDRNLDLKELIIKKINKYKRK